MFSLCLTHSLHGVAFNAIDRYDIRRFTHLVGGEVLMLNRGRNLLFKYMYARFGLTSLTRSLTVCPCAFLPATSPFKRLFTILSHTSGSEASTLCE